jgi:endonuclease YncB( thermonuclease family)
LLSTFPFMEDTLMQGVRQLILIAALLAVAGASACTSGEAGSHKPAYPGAVVIHLRDITFDDGDTFLVGRTPIRILGIDTPEITDPAVGIFEDQPFGRAAADSTRAIVSRARVIELAYDGRDIYHRRLAHVFVDGELLGVKLLGYGLAYENVRHFGDNGFPDLADRIIRAADAGPKPAFEPPHIWRKQHQHRSGEKG